MGATHSALRRTSSSNSQRSTDGTETGPGSGVSVRGLTKVYEARRGASTVAVEDVSFEVGSGEFVSILGPSGCGKTTLLRCIAGLIPYDRGEINSAGALVEGPGADRALVFQDYRLMPWLTIQKNVEFGLRAKGVPKAERQEAARNALELVSLLDFAENYPKQLSGGMQQRAGLARALVVSPTVLLLDEPLGSLDAWTREVLQDEMKTILHEAGKTTVIMVTHSVDEAVYMSDRVIVMTPRPGNVASDVTVELERPRDRQLRGAPEFTELREMLAETLRGFSSGEHK